MRNPIRSKPYTFAVFGGAGLIIIGLLAAGVVSEHANEQTRTCTVTEKDRTTDREGRSDARIYTEQCGTIRVRDMLTQGQFQSADIYAQFEEGHTYRITTVGYRFGLGSVFPSVVGDPKEVTS